MNQNDMERALRALVETIEATGGVHALDGEYAPEADIDWIDLGDAYVLACNALGREPKIAEDVDAEDL